MAQILVNPAVENVAQQRQKKAEYVVNIGLAVNTVLAVVKTIAGIIGHSQALLADGINSTSDVIYYIVIKIFVRLSGAPADEEHPYGHYQFESIAALVIGAFVVTTGIAIFWDSANAAYDLFAKKVSIQPISIFTLWIGCATIIIKIFLMIQAQTIGSKTKNIAISSLAKDHRNDIFSSLSAVVGIVLGLLSFPWFDPLAGAIVAGVVVKTGFSILLDSSSDLMDTLPGKLLSEQISALCAPVRGIDSVEEIHSHRFGPYIVVNLTIGVDGTLTVAEGNRIAHEVEGRLLRDMEMVRKVYVHYHPTTASISSEAIT